MPEVSLMLGFEKPPAPTAERGREMMSESQRAVYKAMDCGAWKRIASDFTDA